MENKMITSLLVALCIPYQFVIAGGCVSKATLPLTPKARAQHEQDQLTRHQAMQKAMQVFPSNKQEAELKHIEFKNKRWEEVRAKQTKRIAREQKRRKRLLLEQEAEMNRQEDENDEQELIALQQQLNRWEKDEQKELDDAELALTLSGSYWMQNARKTSALNPTVIHIHTGPTTILNFMRELTPKPNPKMLHHSPLDYRQSRNEETPMSDRSSTDSRLPIFVGPATNISTSIKRIPNNV